MLAYRSAIIVELTNEINLKLVLSFESIIYETKNHAIIRISFKVLKKSYYWRSIMGDKKQPEANLKGTFFFVIALGIFIIMTWSSILKIYLDRF